ncbi:MAG TPA: hypothetical protein VMV29_03540 [Ktedonobacterales bacterium]|nr:hypothetical protein [Ktedonobacterales bacterium]
MIVRIQADNQYRLADDQATAVEALDERLMQAIDAGDSATFSATLHELVALIQQAGQPVADDEVVASDLIIPASDMSLEEAQQALQKAE